MDEQSAKYVIVGGGLAAASAVEGIRELDKDGSIIIITRETELPYHRPPLSKDFLRGETPLADVYVHDADFYKQNGVTMLAGHEAVALDTAAKTVRLNDGNTLRYDKLLLATGSGSRKLDTPGGDLPAVHYLRTLANCQRLKQQIKEGQRVVIIGGGFIGVEVAASAAQKGAKVTLLNKGKLVWENFGPPVAAFMTNVLKQHGIEIINEDTASAIEANGPALRVITQGGRTLDADLVLAGVGATPYTALAEPHRRQILDLLRDGERHAGELVERLELSQPGVSKHLKVLREAGLVAVRPDGKRRLYALRPEPLAEVDRWLEPYRGFWGRREARAIDPVDRAQRRPDDGESGRRITAHGSRTDASRAR